jgi:quinol monooxygenase YgiN
MAILVTMQVGPVDWTKFKAAIDRFSSERPAGQHSSRAFRQQGDPSRVLVVEEWDSHDAMHAFQEKVGDEFNRLAGTEGMEWDVKLWDLAGEMHG